MKGTFLLFDVARPAQGKEDGWTGQSRVTWVIPDVWCVRDIAYNGRTGP